MSSKALYNQGRKRKKEIQDIIQYKKKEKGHI
jgi:hypothetical protein